MGKRFQKTKTLKDIRQLSVNIEKATRNAFKHLLENIIAKWSDPENKIQLSNRDDKIILPIRPIILGGDDVTFVTDGKLGIYFAKIFMEKFEEEMDNTLTSCAGIAVIKTKYPFYKGYSISEELCRSAKGKRNKINDKGSWLDFHISYGGFSGSLDEIRKEHFNVSRGNLLFRPYKIKSDEKYGFDILIKNTVNLKEFPNSKIHELRMILTRGKEAGMLFIEEQKYRGNILPEIKDKMYKDRLFVDEKTPYFDMIELMEVYPEFELCGKE
jgi:hypothetical protein